MSNTDNEVYDVIGECIIEDVIEILALCLLIAAVSFGAGYFVGKTRVETRGELIKSLGDIDRRNITVDYACRPGQAWKGMRELCGALSKEPK